MKFNIMFMSYVYVICHMSYSCNCFCISSVNRLCWPATLNNGNVLVVNLSFLFLDAVSLLGAEHLFPVRKEIISVIALPRI